MGLSELSRLLLERPGAPEPSLLPWLARHLPEDLLPQVLEAAAAQSEPARPGTWPVVTDAVWQVAVDRDPSFGLSDPPFSHAYRILLSSVRREKIRMPVGKSAVYAFPHVSDPDWVPSILATVEAERSGWLASAMCARIIPFLSARDQARIPDLAADTEDYWYERITELAETATSPWPTAEDELAASHPAVSRLEELVAALDPAQTTPLLRRALDLLRQPVDEPSTGYDRVLEDRVLEDRPPTQGTPWTPPSKARDTESIPLGIPSRNRESEEKHLVSTGFSDAGATDRALPSDQCLIPDTDYVFWFQIASAADPYSLEPETELELPRNIPVGTELIVTVASYPGELRIRPGSDVGRLKTLADGSVVVSGQPDDRPSGGRRLWFPVRTPRPPGIYRLRCNLYCRQTLLQSRLVTVTTSPSAVRRQNALASVVDYAADTVLDLTEIVAQPETVLSIQADSSGRGTSTFRFLGAHGDHRSSTVFGEGQMHDALLHARGRLNLVSWGDKKEWDPARHAYRYAAPPGAAMLEEDLKILASAGFRLWDTVVDELAGHQRIRSFQDRMREPGIVELTGRLDQGHVLPAALFYDYPLDSGDENLKVCDSAFKAIMRGVHGAPADLSGHPCFLGFCPDYETCSVVCPGGFWGFRHQIGLPPSLLPPTRAQDLAQRVHPVRRIQYHGQPNVLVAVSTEFDQSHPQRVRNLGEPGSSRIYDNRRSFMEALRAPGTSPHLLYFYCHGVLADGVPLLVVGPPGSPGIAAEHVGTARMDWSSCTPLVFLNGCETTALRPDRAMSFVRTFVRRASAAGVVGTEITVFTSLASEFGEQMVEGFVRRGMTLGEALRSARLALLARGNPLGLAYVGYAPPQLVMRRS